tara:strand:- start:35 stop:967 length:933 start_codon:yes stop_codon:yes gene_type:complete
MNDLVPIVCDKRAIEVRHFTTGRIGNLSRCDLLITVNGDEYQMSNRREVFDLVAALCSPTPAPYRQDVYDAMYSAEEPFAEVLRDLIQEAKAGLMTLWVHMETTPDKARQVESIGAEVMDDYLWMQGLIASIRERGHMASITTTPFSLNHNEGISNRVCIEVTTKQNSKIIISQRERGAKNDEKGLRNKRKRLAFVTRCPVNIHKTKGKFNHMSERLEGLFVQPISTIWLDGTFGSVDANGFMDAFIRCEDATVLADALVFTITNTERMEQSRRAVGERRLKTNDLFTIERMDSQDAINYFQLFGGDTEE